ncbi:MAG: UPF0175 family protein [Isosphaeraceae bacterium]|nr:UPF0175 family protein [Isosphaeraceae bacterium]
MPVVISDETLQEAGLSEQEARVEFACHLFDQDRLTLWKAAELAGLTRPEFEEELSRRKIPLYRPTAEDVVDDLAALKRLGL